MVIINSASLWRLSNRKGVFEMSIRISPKIGDTLFLMHREVVVIKVYTLFRLVTVRYLDEMKEFCVDVCALSREPDYTNSISLRLLKGEML